MDQEVQRVGFRLAHPARQLPDPVGQLARQLRRFARRLGQLRQEHVLVDRPLAQQDLRAILEREEREQMVRGRQRLPDVARDVCSLGIQLGEVTAVGNHEPRRVTRVNVRQQLIPVGYDGEG